MSTYPAPWRVDAYLPAQSEDGAYVWGVRSADNTVVLSDCGESIAKQVTAARNACPDEAASLGAMRERYERALEYQRNEVQAVRDHFQREVSTLMSALESARAEGEVEG